MTDSTLPPPPPPATGQGGADSPLPPAKPAAAKTPVVKPPATKPRAAKPAAAKPPAAKPAAATEPTTAPAAPPAPITTPYGSLPAPPPSTLSVLSLVFGIMGLVFSFFFLGFLPAIAGVILGHLALKREPHARGMAIAGLSTGYTGLAVSVLWAIVVIVPTLVILLATLGFGAAALRG